MTNSWKKVWIVALSVLAIGVFIFACAMAALYLQKYHKTYYWDSLARRVSPTILMVYGDRGDTEFARLKDLQTGKYTTPELQHIFVNEYASEDSLVVFRTFDRLRGYLNLNTGRIIIPAQYNRAWNFSEGIAAALKDGEIFFINSNGERAFPQSFPITYTDDYYDIAPMFHNGLCVMRTMENKWGLINTRGEWAVEPVFNSIHAPRFGYYVVSDGKRYGLLSASGKMALPMEYDFIRLASDGNGYVLAKDGIAQEVDRNLKVTIPFVYDGLSVLEYVDSYRSHDYEKDGTTKFIVPKYWRYDVGEGSGVIDLNGKVIIPAKYFMVRMVDDHLFEAEVSFGGDRILFNDKGEYVGTPNQ